LPSLYPWELLFLYLHLLVEWQESVKPSAGKSYKLPTLSGSTLRLVYPPFLRGQWSCDWSQVCMQDRRVSTGVSSSEVSAPLHSSLEALSEHSLCCLCKLQPSKDACCNSTCLNLPLCLPLWLSQQVDGEIGIVSIGSVLQGKHPNIESL
jgi:hypothetical protein